MGIKHIVTDCVPSSVLYSQGIVAGQFIYTSGQIGMNYLTNQLENKTFENEVIQALENIRLILKAEKLDLEDVIKITIFITDIKQFYNLNNIYTKYFPKHKPARSCVAVNSLALGARVEIEAIAYKGKGSGDI